MKPRGQSKLKYTLTLTPLFFPISPDFFKSLPIREGSVFKYGYSTLKRRIKNLSFTLPAGQMSHVLRHTFASHFIQNGGNILVLQKILGHGSLLMTMLIWHQNTLKRQLNSIQ